MCICHLACLAGRGVVLAIVSEAAGYMSVVGLLIHVHICSDQGHSRPTSSLQLHVCRKIQFSLTNL